MVPGRDALFVDLGLHAGPWCAAHSGLIDAWLAEVFDAAVAATGGRSDATALVAIGGYGRGELCPHSDIDVMLVHDKRKDIGAVAERIWYPIWDEGMKLGHSVSTVKEALGLAADDLDTATALLSVRHLAGDAALSRRLSAAATEQWANISKRSLAALAARVEERHAFAGEVAFLLEPDLKEGRGGLRDVHSLHWAEAALHVVFDHDKAELDRSYETLLAARVELHRQTRRPHNVLSLQEQPGIARSLGFGSTDELMAALAAAGRTIAWVSDDTWRRVRSILRGPLSRNSGGAQRVLEPGLQLEDGEVHVDASAAIDATSALRAAVHAARDRTAIERRSLERLAAETPPMPEVWPAEARGLLVDLLLSGAAAIPIVEALDQRGLWVRILPEWEAVQSRPQHNAYHRFTVDRHLLEAAANAAQLAPGVDRPDLLVLAALLHDIGKGSPGDHTSVGVSLAQRIGARMGLPPSDVSTVAALVEHHLLLPEIATRRDIDDPATIALVGAAVGSPSLLTLLRALTEADALATGPAAWTPWRAGLVDQLVERVAADLTGGTVAARSEGGFPSAAHVGLLQAGGDHVAVGDGRITVVTDDKPGVFSRVAGVCALHGLDVLAAAAHSADGRALSEFRVADSIDRETPWERVRRDLALALDGRLAIQARVAERAQRYGARAGVPTAITATVSFDNQASDGATVIDVHTQDAVGVLYRITKALAELDLDIQSARVQTLGHAVVDAFYVRDNHGDKIADTTYQAEIERAILNALGS